MIRKGHVGNISGNDIRGQARVHHRTVPGGGRLERHLVFSQMAHDNAEPCANCTAFNRK